MKSLYQLSATALKSKLDNFEISSVDIIKALLARTKEIGQLANGYALVFEEEALAKAKKCDEERKAGKLRGLLHGLPISIKDTIDKIGTASTLGVKNRASLIAKENAVMVDLLEQEGAIIMGKTNIPQALLSGMECNNPLYGQTRNPWKLTHGPGGSSGGEGAVIASGESVFGLGTDLGGSIRFPASFCGIVGFKPTTFKWSGRGITSALVGQEVIKAQVGPMARSVDDIILLMQALDSPKHHAIDPTTPPVPLGDLSSVTVKGMRIGYYLDDGFFTPATVCQRATQKAIDILKEKGAEMIPIELDNQLEVVKLYTSIVSSGGMKPLKKLLQGETILTSTKSLWTIGRIPDFAKQASKSILPKLGEARLGELASTMQKKPVRAFWQMVDQRNKILEKEQKKWRELGIQAMVCPTTAAPPVPLGETKEFSAVFGYTGRYNLLGFPAGTIPITKVTKAETKSRQDATDRIEKRAILVESQSEGLPIGAQVVALPWQDHIALKLMQVIEKEARKSPDFPVTPITPKAI